MVDDIGDEPNVDGLVDDIGRTIVPVDSKVEVLWGYQDLFLVLGNLYSHQRRDGVMDVLTESVGWVNFLKYFEWSVPAGSGHNRLIFRDIWIKCKWWVGELGSYFIDAIWCPLDDIELAGAGEVDFACILGDFNFVRIDSQVDGLAEFEAHSVILVNLNGFLIVVAADNGLSITAHPDVFAYRWQIIGDIALDRIKQWVGRNCHKHQH